MGFETPKMPSPEDMAKKEKVKPHPEIALGTSSEQARITERPLKWKPEAAYTMLETSLKERADLFPAEKTRPIIEEHKTLLGHLEKGLYGKVLNFFEQKLGKGIKLDKETQDTHYESEFKGTPIEEDQERLRAYVGTLTEKEYQKRGKELKPANFEELSAYLNKEIKDWELSPEDPSIIALKRAMTRKDYGFLANQIDVSIAAKLDDLETLKSNAEEAKTLKRTLEEKYHTGSPLPHLNMEIDNLRRHRSFLYEQLAGQGA